MSRQHRQRKHKASWQIQEAKARFSEFVNEALIHGAQTITRHGQQIAVLMSQQDFEQYIKPKEPFLDFFRKAPCQDIELDLQRSCELPRDITL